MTSSAGGLRLYWETIRHLKPVQLYGRLWFRFARPKINLSPAPPLRAAVDGVWTRPAERRASMFGPSTFSFLNATRELDDGGWEDAGASKLWLYNLHYFDDLNAEESRARRDWHSALIARWINENPPGTGTGWEPYPTSLRIVNWIKFARQGGGLAPAAIQSLAAQTRWLTVRLEHHLLGNHLFANAKALVFAGCFFEGAEAESWLTRGLAILNREVDEQILPDGGHFELSTMYHALALEDFIDIANILRSSGNRIPVGWDDRIAAMRDWLSVMTHADGEVAFFNDAAIGIAPAPAELDAYAVRTGFPLLQTQPTSLRHLADSGYIRVQSGAAVAWLDVARVGPDYLPGHAHADTLSFELSVEGHRALVNSGTSVYGDDEERQRQRGTAAHNTVIIDGRDSSEVWSGFRVARRARPRDLELHHKGSIEVSCSHDGYRWAPGAPRHMRRWRFDAQELEVVDQVVGRHGKAEAMFLFHPDFGADPDCGTSGLARTADGVALRWSVIRGFGRLEAGTWHPEFGVKLMSQRLVVELDGGESRVKFSWALN